MRPLRCCAAVQPRQKLRFWQPNGVSTYAAQFGELSQLDKTVQSWSGKCSAFADFSNANESVGLISGAMTHGVLTRFFVVKDVKAN